MAAYFASRLADSRLAASVTVALCILGLCATPTVLAEFSPATGLANISTRLKVETGENVLISGFIVTGPGQVQLVARGIGSSLAAAGIPNPLLDPMLEINDSDGNTVAANDNWRDTQETELEAIGIPPQDDSESAIIVTLGAGTYTALLRGVNDTIGVGLVEVYNIGGDLGTQVANISTRGVVGTGNDVMIGGIIIQGSRAYDVLVRAIGPSLSDAGVKGALKDPTLELVNEAGEVLAANDDWRDTQQAEIEATTIPPASEAESAIVHALTAGNYTAVVRGANNAVGIALVEVYNLTPAPTPPPSPTPSTPTPTPTVTPSPTPTATPTPSTPTPVPRFALTVSKEGSGAGVVTSSPEGINCGQSCSTTYDSGTIVALTATPDGVSTFTGWSGACSGTGTCNVTMNAATSVTANFTLNNYTLTVSRSGDGFGTVTSSPGGIDCGTTCSAEYAGNTVVTLTATSSGGPSGSAFTGWTGACTGTGDCTVPMDAAKSVVANFALNCGVTCFVEPYAADGSRSPSPLSTNVGLPTQLQKVDVAIVTDTAASMGGEINVLKTTLSTNIIPALQTRVPSLGVGIAAHDDMPYSVYGTAGCDLPFYFPSSKGPVTTVTGDSQSAADALATHCGADVPQSQLPALYHAITGSGLTWPGGSVAAVTAPTGTFGAMRFRSDAFSLIVNITDSAHHNGKRALDTSGTSYDSAYQNTYSSATFNADNVVAAINAVGAKFIGISADAGARGVGAADPYGYHAYITDKTNSNVPPSAFTGGTCKTGVSGAAVTADGPTVDGVQQCRSVFSAGTNGTGLDTSIANGVIAVLNTAEFDIYVRASDLDPGDGIDAVDAFLEKIEPQPAGGTDPVTGQVCVSFPANQLSDNFTGPKATAGADGNQDTITQVNPGPTYCFKVTAKANTAVPQTAQEQPFSVRLRVLAIKPGGTIAASVDRQVLFVVPPIGN